MKLKVLSSVILVSFGLILGSDLRAEQVYKVKPGDSLSSIAYQFYRDQAKWPAIQQANPDQVRENGTLIIAGASLVIPELGDLPLQPVRSEGGGIIHQDAASGVTQIDLVTGGDYKPYSDEADAQGGMFTEIVDKAFRHMGYEPVIDFASWASGYSLTNRGKFAATFPYAPTEERKADFLYSESIADTLTFVWWRKDRGLKFQQLDDLKGNRVCRPKGYFAEFLDPLTKTGQIDFYQPTDLDTCFSDVMAGTADMVVIGDLDGQAKLIEMKLADQIAKSDVAADVGGLHVIFPKSVPESQALLDELNAAVRDMSASGETQEIVERHMKAYYASFEQQATN